MFVHQSIYLFTILGAHGFLSSPWSKRSYLLKLPTTMYLILTVKYMLCLH
jgi:hypothetical protein